ncbi:MAG: hypothetical protein ACE5K3_00890 [bacterium]
MISVGVNLMPKEKMVKEVPLLAKKGKDNFYPIGLTCHGCRKWTPEFSIDLKTGKAYCESCLAQGKVDKDKDLFLQGTYRLELNPIL